MIKKNKGINSFIWNFIREISFNFRGKLIKYRSSRCL